MSGKMLISAVACMVLISIPFSQAQAGTDVVIEGADAKLTKTLRNSITFLVTKGRPNLDDIHRAIETLFATDAIEGVSVFREEKGDNAVLIFKVVTVHYLKSVQFSGNKSFSYNDLLSATGLTEGEPFNEELADAAVGRLKVFYSENGFPNVQIEGRAPSDDTSEVTFVFNIQEGTPSVVTNLEFKSPNQKLNQDLQKAFKKYVGRIQSLKLHTDLMKEIQQYLINERYLGSIVQNPEMTLDPTKTKVVFSFEIQSPYSYSFVFEGNETYTSVKLINEMGLESSGVVTGSPVQDLSDRLLRFYKKNGYALATVSLKESVFSRDYVRLITFTIKEGLRVRIKSISFEGRFSQPLKFYSRHIFEHSGELIEKEYFNAEDLDTGIKNLVTELQNQGFINAKISSTRVEFDPKRTGVDVKINLEEGPQTLLSNVVFAGNKKITQSDLEEAIGLRAQKPLRLSAVEESVAKIVELYRSRGYLDAKVTNQGKTIITYSADNSHATLKFDIHEGPLVTVQSIIIEGNRFTRDFVVERELQFELGDVLTPEKMIYSEQRLQRLSLFTSVEISVLMDDPSDGRRTVLITVREGNPGTFNSGFGANNELELSVKGFVGVSYRNLFGTGRGFTSRLELNNKVYYAFTEYDVNFGYTEPFVLGTKNTGRVNLIKSRKITKIENLGDTLVTAVDNSQVNFLLERDLTKDLRLIYEAYGFAQTNQFEIHDKGPSQPLDIATVGPTLIYDRRDNLFNPTTGSLSSLSFEYSTPYLGSTQTVNYYRSILSHTRYFTIGPVVWASEGRAGYMRNLSPLENGAIPQVKGFYLGGRSTIRGFSPRESFPLLSDMPNGISTDTAFYLAKTEMRFPIAGNFGGVVFYDGGTVVLSDNPIYNSKFRWRDSVGLGFRYRTPFGPFSVEYGRKLNRDSERREDDHQWHISIGAF